MTAARYARQIRRETNAMLAALIASLPKRRRGEHQRAHPYRQTGYFAGSKAR